MDLLTFTYISLGVLTLTGLGVTIAACILPSGNQRRHAEAMRKMEELEKAIKADKQSK